MSFTLVASAGEERVLSFLYDNIQHCPYLYIDIKEYGIGKGVIDVWTQEDDRDSRIISVLMRYTDGFQVFAPSNDAPLVDVGTILELADEHSILRIQGPKELIARIQREANDSFEVGFGSILELKHYHVMENKNAVIEEASVNDVPEIVDLLLSTEETSDGYKREATIDAFASRLESGFGKNWIIRKDNEIVAHLSLSAICDEFAVAAYTVVREDHRGYPYGIFLDSYLMNVVLPACGKRTFTFITESRRIKLFEHLGNPVVSEYGILRRN